MNLCNGSLLAGGRYKIERVLGSGGFGITYLAEQTDLCRKVAIKEFFMKECCERSGGTPQVSLGSSGSREKVARYREKFIKEARNIAKLKHPGIVQVMDMFEDNGTVYYVMEYLEGGSLSDKIKSAPLSEPVALRYICQVADALSYVHSCNMLHLDVKPGNILLNKDEQAVLVDFGVSKHYDAGGSQTTITPVGVTHGYAPLEQYANGGVGTFSPSTDIYSLGATLYKLLTGDTPPCASDIIDDGPLPLPATVSPAVRKAIYRAMQPSRALRPQSIDEFLAILDREALMVNDGRIIGIDATTPKAKAKNVKEVDSMDIGHTQ